MSDFAVVTPSFRPDYESLVELHRSVLRHTADDVIHHVIVPAADYVKFRALASSRLKLHRNEDFLPSSFVSTYRVLRPLRSSKLLRPLGKIEAINLRRPWPPIRGWILQQIIKLAITSQLSNKAVLIVDSDVALIRMVSDEDVAPGGMTRHYKLPRAVHQGMPNHRRWLAVSRTLLGTDSTIGRLEPDYICSFMVWEPNVVRRLLARIEAVNGNWLSAIAAQRNFSEFMLYGTYIERFEPELETRASDQTLCTSYWDTRSLSAGDLLPIVDQIGVNDVAIQVQSTSQTEMGLRRELVRMAEARASLLSSYAG